MTTPPAARPASPRRQQLVTAALVGTVVVVLGFASGIGVETSTSATQAAPTAPAPTEVAPTTVAPTPTRTPINYIGVGTPPPAGAVQPAATVAKSPSAVPSTAATSPATTRHSTTPVPSSATTCPTNILNGLLDSVSGVLSGTTSGTQDSGLLSLVSGLLGGTGSTPLGGVLDLLGLGASDPGVTYTPFSTASDAPTAADLVPIVGDLLPGVLSGLPGSASVPATSALTTACAAGLLPKLPLIGGTS